MSEEKQFDANKYRQSYQKEHYGRLGIQYPKDKNYKERIQAIATRDGISVNQWIIRAIEKELEWYE